MLKYLIVQLDDSSTSFCHYGNDNERTALIDLDILKQGLFWSMKENLTVQLLYPSYQLPADYKKVIEGIDHIDIVPSDCEDSNLLNNADVIIFNTWASIGSSHLSKDSVYVVRTSFDELFTNEDVLKHILSRVSRLNVVITDIEKLSTATETKYGEFLERINEGILQEYRDKHSVQLNILTDRMMLNSMNNCGAGDETITLAPNGKFYVCPGFYFDGSKEIGSIEKGLDIKNPQLYKLEYAPICKICDSWHCRRCVWQNKRLTLEVNTPSHEQCVTAHLERNASRNLLSKIQTLDKFIPKKEIPQLGYLDPYEIIINK